MSETILTDTKPTPKLIVGLGGTGSEILLRIRRRLFEVYGTLDTSKTHTAFLLIDTDKEMGKAPYGLPPDYITRKTTLDHDERCLVTVDSTTANNMEVDTELYHNIWAWADDGLFSKSIKDAMALKSGAMQMPPVGRLICFVNARKIRDSLMASLGKFKGFGDPKITVVGSLAGGTGAGMCLDVAAMLRCGKGTERAPGPFALKGFDSLNKATIWGYFVLPEALLKDAQFPVADRSRALANGYAMLQELERANMDRSNKATILEQGERMRGTWFWKGNLNEAPVISRVFDTCYLFDGHGEGLNAIRDRQDIYNLVSGLIFQGLEDSKTAHGFSSKFQSAENNIQHSIVSGHIETMPPGVLRNTLNNDQVKAVMRSKDTLWGNVYSFNFAAAGMARITIEEPRLRMMAQYRLLLATLEAWRGKRSPNDMGLIGEPAEIAHGVCRSLGKLFGITLNAKWNVEKKAFERLEDAQRLDLFRPIQPVKWPLVKALLAKIKKPDLDSKTYAGGNLTKAFEDLRNPTQFDAKSVLNLLLDTYFKAGSPAEIAKDRADGKVPTVEHLAQELVDAFPMEEHTRFQGGLEALGCLSGAHGTGALRELLDCMRGELAASQQDHEAYARENKLLANDASAACREADRLWRIYDEANRAFFPFVEKEKAKTNWRSAAAVARDTLWGFVEEHEYASVYRACKEAIDQLLDGPELRKRETAWTDIYSKGKDFLDKFIEEIRTLFDELRAIKPDVSTLHIGLPMQRRETKLWAEIERVYDNKREALMNRMIAIQSGIRTQAYGNVGEKASALDLFLSDFSNLHREDQLDSILAVVRDDPAEAINRNLLNTDDMNIPKLLDSPKLAERLSEVYNEMDIDTSTISMPMKWLADTCKPRAELPIPKDISRQKYVGVTDTAGMGEQEWTYQYLIGPADLDKAHLSNKCEHVITTNVHEILAIEFEVSVPLPNFSVLQTSWRVQFPANELHFFKPKTAYPPIHRIQTKEEGAERMNRAVQAILAVMVGQFRPWKISPESESCFALFGTGIARPVPYALITSVGDLIYHLGQNGKMDDVLEHLGVSRKNEDNISRVVALEHRNMDILGKLEYEALVVLFTIAKYNVRFVSELHANFQAGELTYGPQEMVLMRVMDKIEEKLEKLYPDRKQDRQKFVNLCEQVGTFLHHVAEFVPLSLPHSKQKKGKDEGGYMLALRTELRLADEQQAHGGLLSMDEAKYALGRMDTVVQRTTYEDHEIIKPIYELRNPLDLYIKDNERDVGAETLRIHRKICGLSDDAQCCMNPNSTSERTSLGIPPGFRPDEFISTAIAKAGPKGKPGVPDWSKLLPVNRVSGKRDGAPENAAPASRTIVSGDDSIKFQAASPAHGVRAEESNEKSIPPKHFANDLYQVHGHDENGRKLPIDEIVSLIDKGQFDENTWVAQTGWSQWRQAKDVPELFRLFPSAQSSIAPKPDFLR